MPADDHIIKQSSFDIFLYRRERQWGKKKQFQMYDKWMLKSSKDSEYIPTWTHKKKCIWQRRAQKDVTAKAIGMKSDTGGCLFILPVQLCVRDSVCVRARWRLAVRWFQPSDSYTTVKRPCESILETDKISIQTFFRCFSFSGLSLSLKIICISFLSLYKL